MDRDLFTKTKLDLSIKRRELIKAGVGVSLTTLVGCTANDESADGWRQGKLSHLIPLVSHQSMNIKVSFIVPLTEPPQLKVNQLLVTGQKTDSHGRFWQFVISGLEAGQQHRLQILDHHGAALCDSWPLATFPAPTDTPDACRVISYTCAGGPDLPVLPGGRDAFKPAAYRRKLFDQMLDKDPDIIIANGDHIYWDYRSWAESPDSDLAKKAVQWFLSTYGEFDEGLPVLGSSNELTLTTIADDQIASIYGVRFRSTPVFFVTDDHDYFENDDATEELITFPPRPFNIALRNTLQSLYFPEFIIEEPMPTAFPGLVNNKGLTLSTHFGSCRYGKLFESVIYDCGGMLSLDEAAGLVPQLVESWLVEKTAHEDTRHFAHIPSHPMGWTAGKWREWYPDLLSSTGSLLVPIETDQNGGKYAWQQGWWQQHQRLLNALASQEKRKPLLISGDLHALGATKIIKSGALNFRKNPIYSILSGPVGVGGLGWLSKARGVSAQAPKQLETVDFLAAQERNGFTLLDINNDNIQVTLYRCPQGYVDASQLTLEQASRFDV